MRGYGRCLAALAFVGCGRLGFDPSGTGAGDAADAAIDAGPTEVVQVSVGGRTSCARLGNGDVWCWGRADSGRLGDGVTTVRSAVPVHAALPEAAVDVQGGDGGVCALLASNKVACWGDNAKGTFGLGDSSPRLVPTIVPGLVDVAGLTIGFDFACVNFINGTVACAGAAALLGDNSPMDRASFAVLPGLDRVRALTTGDSHVCALRDLGDVHCWGFNATGALGDGSFTARATPSVGPIGPYVSIAAGDFYSCGVREAGGVDCWGDASRGQLGDESVANRSDARPVLNVSDATSMSAGSFTPCVLHRDQTVGCWGDGGDGGLGDGTVIDRGVVGPAMISGVVELRSRTDLHTCARTVDHRVACWGSDDLGQLGNGVVDNVAHPIPEFVVGLP